MEVFNDYFDFFMAALSVVVLVCIVLLTFSNLKRQYEAERKCLLAGYEHIAHIDNTFYCIGNGKAIDIAVLKNKEV